MGDLINPGFLPDDGDGTEETLGACWFFGWNAGTEHKENICKPASIDKTCYNPHVAKTTPADSTKT